MTAAPSTAAATSVTAPSITLSSTAAGVPGVTYVTEFATSTTGGLAAGSGTVTVALPTGSVIPNQGVSIVNATTGLSIGGTSLPTLTNGQAKATWTVQQTVPAGTIVDVVIPGVTNAAAGAGQAQISTSADSNPAATSNFQLTNPQPVTSPSVALSTPVQGVGGVSYTVDFTTSSTGDLQPGQGTITLSLPAGSVIPNGGISVTDLSGGQGISTSTATLTNNGATARWTVNGVVSAGDRIQLVITGVTNPGAGGTVSVSTSSDPTPVNTSTPTLVPAQQLSTPSVALSTPVQGVGGVSYTVDFTTSSTGDLQPGQGTITLSLPAGSVIPNGGISVTDLSGGQGISTSTATLTNNGATARWTVNGVVSAGDRIELQLDGVQNASTGGTVSVSTSSDPTPISSSSITLTPKQSLSAAVVELSDTTPAQTNVSYTVDFTTSSTGDLQAGQGTITVDLPAGSTIPNGGISVTDLSGGQGISTSTATLTNNDATARWTVNGVIPAGDRIQLVITGVTNPGAGNNAIQITTSSDNPTTTPAYQIGVGAPPPQFGPSVLLSSTAAGIQGVTYEVTFFNTTTLASGTGTISLSAPTGTSFPNRILSLFDLTTGQSLSGTFGPLGGGGSNSDTWTVGQNVPANHEIRVTITGVRNPPVNPTGGTYQISVASSGVPTGTASNPYQIVAASPLAPGRVTISTPAAGVQKVTYSVEFTTSATGTLYAGQGNITLTAPTGTKFPNQTLGLVDLTTGQSLGSSFGPLGGGGTNSDTWTVGQTIPAGHTIRATITNVMNPPAGSSPITISTSTDTGGNTPNYTTTPPNPLTPGAVSLTNSAVGASGVTYSVEFTTSSTGMLYAGQGTITLTAPFGTTFPIQALSLFDLTTGLSLGATFGPGAAGNPLTWVVGQTVPAGHTIRATITNVTNPGVGNTSDQIAISTSSDTGANTSPYTIGGSGSTPAPPTATITAPPDNQTYNLGQAVATAFSCKEGLNGPGLQSCLDSNGTSGGVGALDTSTAGPHTYTVTAVSTDGQNGTASIHYTVSSPPAPSPPPPAPAAPAVSGGAPTSRTIAGASVSGSVNPEGAPTQAFFQYGLDPSQRGPGASSVLYDQSTPSQQVGSDQTNHAVSATLTGLIPGGLYHVRLVATSGAGTSYGPDQTFTSAASPAPPAPVLAKSQDLKPVSGTVFIKAPNGQFIPLTGATQIPSGTVVDALGGTLAITTALPGGSGRAHDAAAKAKKPAKTQSGTFGGAIFKITQAGNGLVTLSLVEGAYQGAPSYATCTAHKAGEASAAALSSRTLQLLRASAHGRFRTSGRYSAATVRGTKWTTADRCDGTLTHDITDSVSIQDFVHHKTIILHAGQSYLARAPGHGK